MWLSRVQQGQAFGAPAVWETREERGGPGEAGMLVWALEGLLVGK